jgi:predicted enzyme related to lactoylglutathione lyase
MYNPIHWLEIATIDLERARKFYQDAFDLKFEYVEMPDSKMYMFGETEGIGTGGCLVHSADHKPSTEGTLIYFSTEAMTETLQRIEAGGGKVLVPRTDIGEFGFFAHFLDTEGNKIGLHASE